MNGATVERPKRLIPMFLLRGRRLVKGTQFGDHVDVGDPVSQAMIYDAQGAEEIALVDIDASRERRTFDPALLSRMIASCRLPIAAGGGIASVADARTYFAAGADKIIVNTHAVLRPALVRELSLEFGAQSVLVSVDVRRVGDRHVPVVFSGTQEVAKPLDEVLGEGVAAGAGEVLLTSVDREGTLEGLDVELSVRARPHVPVPMIASGGAGSYDHLVHLFRETDCDACGLGKMLSLRDYDIVRIKAFLRGRGVPVREA